MKIKSLIIFVSILSIVIYGNSVFAAHYFNGGGRDFGDDSNILGAKAYVECDSVYRDDDVSCWVMVGAPDTISGGGNYYQVGWCRDNINPTNNWHFAEYKDDSLDLASFVSYYSIANSGTYAYRVEKINNTWQAYVNDVQIHSKNGLTWNGQQIAFCGETHSTEDQTPGTNYDPVTISTIKYKNSSGSWENGALNVKFNSLSTQKNNMSANGTNTFEQWDSRY